MMRALRILLAMLFYTLLLCGIAAANPETFKGDCVEVIDGDTIKVGVWQFDPETRKWDRDIRVVRLANIDAPELTQPHGLESRNYLFNLIFGSRVEVSVTGRDWYGRLIGQVNLIDYPYSLNVKLDVNSSSVLNGHAWWYRKHAPRDAKLRLFEQTARSEKSGLWASPSAIAPWEFRVRESRIFAPASSHDCWESMLILLRGRYRKWDPTCFWVFVV